jgi:hypothetical protein
MIQWTGLVETVRVALLAPAASGAKLENRQRLSSNQLGRYGKR